MLKDSSLPTEYARESSQISIAQQEIDFCKEPPEVVELVKDLILKYAEYNPQARNINNISCNSHRRTWNNIPKSSKIAKERWAAIKRDHKHEYQFWLELTKGNKKSPTVLHYDERFRVKMGQKSVNMEIPKGIEFKTDGPTLSTNNQKQAEICRINEVQNIGYLDVEADKHEVYVCPANISDPVEDFNDTNNKGFYFNGIGVNRYTPIYQESIALNYLLPSYFTMVLYNPYLNSITPSTLDYFSNDLIDPLLINNNNIFDTSLNNF
ncbi:9652_t:CDS:2, partial [Racocetra persica]